MRKREKKTEYNVSKSRVPGFGTFLSFRRKAICNCSGMNRTSCEVENIEITEICQKVSQKLAGSHAGQKKKVDLASTRSVHRRI
jgi:hypothetical protein